MIFGKIVGTVVSTQMDKGIKGKKCLLVQTCNHNSRGSRWSRSRRGSDNISGELCKTDRSYPSKTSRLCNRRNC